MIGFQDQPHEGEIRKEPVIMIETGDPRVGAEQGVPLFLPQGGDSPYLERVKGALRRVHQGQVFDQTMMTSFERMDLFEPLSIEISLSNIEKLTFQDYYTISEQKLAALDAESLYQLNQLGVLKLAFFALSSLGNFNRLIALKNQKDAMVQ